MKTLLSSLLILVFLLLQGCIQAPSNARKTTLSSSSTTTTGGKTAASPTVYPTFATDENLYWYSTTKIITTITVNKTSQDVVYIRGKLVHDFLNAKDIHGTEYFRKQFCMEGNFSTPAYKQIRVRAIPIYITTSTNAIERILRIDIPNGADNLGSCKDTPTTTTAAATAAAAFSLPDICPTCTGQVTTTSLNLFEATTTNLVRVPNNLVDFSAIALRTDLTSNSTNPNSSCTNSACSAKGFDCCISGQCVKDASEKLNAKSDAQYSQAKTDYAANPLSFINYPNIFYICTNISHIPPTTTTPVTTTPLSDAQARVAQYLTDYTCITDVSAGIGYNNCRNLSSTGVPTAIDKTEAAFTAIKKKLAIACGCTATADQMALKCPDWGIVPVYLSGALKTNANITDFTCFTPAPVNPIGPITNLNLSVPNRSAPHRFYSSTGVNFDDLTGFQTKSPGTLQEGDDFYYLDEINKIGPVNGAFNINSVIGKMTVDLSHAIPAKVVTVELGKTYIISATSGLFTPCSKCVRDSWFQTFTAFPTTSQGKGLQATGYTTSRDTFAANTSLGNFEDTNFGRACYVPVTMLPLSHQKNANLQTQRQNRLKTQAAFYINGYQRDWYGFNKGALIGSYDGVTWFAIGTGRRSTATSTKLFLALNASFFDLVDKSDTLVNIIPDFSVNTAADYDFDPEIGITDPRQNSGATCQQFHQCNVDSDCVTQLGWEYACADISQFKTKWPQYDSNANETANQELSGSLFEILQNTISTSTSKRCIYRGAGAPCKRDYTTLTEFTKKALTCAPNFYCASISSNKFNDQLARSPNELDDILFGMDANILGRPLNYVTANKTLTGEIISNIKYNAANAIGVSAADSDDMGMCRPGKLLTTSDLNAHSNPDLSKRTDYISQIGSCNSGAGTITGGTLRYATCPAFDNTLNYVDPAAADVLTQKLTQNSCGAEAKHVSTLVSAFKGIEGLSLLNLQIISQPTLVQDACLRRAGSVCHTDLDCGPNRMHEDSVGAIDLKFFGGTDGEMQYWKESLVCGQATDIPALGSKNFFDFKLSDNRCCREIGKDFTMITQGPKTIVPENTGTNETLITRKFTVNAPSAANRYSRYTISKIGIDDTSTIPAVTNLAGDPAVPVDPNVNQWKVINETGSLTCCGGGWIRKFADGTHDWKVKNRLNLDASNFTCLNFRSPLADINYSSFVTDKIVKASYQRDFENFCQSPDGTGCLQILYPNSTGKAVISPRRYEPSLSVPQDNDIITMLSGSYPSIPALGQTRFNTSPNTDPFINTDFQQNFVNSDVPFMPIVGFNYTPIPLDTDPTSHRSFTFFTSQIFDYGVEMFLPAYIGWDGTIDNQTFIKRIYIKYFYDKGNPKVYEMVGPADVGDPAECATVMNNPPPIPVDAITGSNKWCIISNIKTQNRPVLIVKADTDVVGNSWKYASIIIDFEPIETKRINADATAIVTSPGDQNYYLTKLGRLELLGIPQITYEPLYCNNNQSKLVPGIFKPTIKTRTDFVGASLAYSGTDPIERHNDDNSNNQLDSFAGIGNVEQRFTYQDKVAPGPVFSSKDFTCCTPLGKSSASAAKCCSGFSALSADKTTTICKLPTGTDLNVYFNKFVSNEGVGVDQPGGGLKITGTDPLETDVDFNQYTGEPKFRDSTDKVLFALGVFYCQNSKVARGAAFGQFPPEPFSGAYTVPTGGAGGDIQDSFPISIVDSIIDFQKSDPTVGKVPFDSGNRWNHHFYCN